MKLPPLIRVGRAVRLLGWVGLVFTGFYWLALFALNLRKGHPENMLPALVFTASVTTIMSVIYIVTGIGLMKGRPWSRYAGAVLGVVMLAVFPIGTFLGVYTLWCVIKGWKEAYV